MHHQWVKSSKSVTGNCVEVAEGEGEGVIVLRESDRPRQLITTSRANFEAFVAGVKAGEFDQFLPVAV